MPSSWFSNSIKGLAGIHSWVIVDFSFSVTLHSSLTITWALPALKVSLKSGPHHLTIALLQSSLHTSLTLLKELSDHITSSETFLMALLVNQSANLKSRSPPLGLSTICPPQIIPVPFSPNLSLRNLVYVNLKTYLVSNIYSFSPLYAFCHVFPYPRTPLSSPPLTGLLLTFNNSFLVQILWA